MDITASTCRTLTDAVTNRTVTAQAIAAHCLERIRTYNSRLNAVVACEEEDVLQQAAAVDERAAAGKPLGPLAGVPVMVKDNICRKGRKTTCASRLLAEYRPPYDAMVVEQIRAADGLILGTANMDEFAMGSSTENSAYGPAVNPRCPERVPGGSSGGSAVAVAAGFCPVALGSDTGGSIRQPASHTGVVGFKPTYGRVSRYGLVAFGSSLDQIGPFGRCVDDLRPLMHVISAPDPRDGTNKGMAPAAVRSSERTDFSGLKIGIPGEYIVEGIDPEVLEIFNRSRDAAEQSGAEIVEISLPRTEYGVAVYYIIACAEASSNLARYDGAHYGHRGQNLGSIVEMFSSTRAEGFGAEVKRRILLGTHVLSAGYYDAYYNKALKVRNLLKQDFEQAFGICDAIMCPVAPSPAFKVGELVDDPLRMYLSDIFTISVNLAGLPAVSVPAGYAAGSLPVGVQFIGPHWSDDQLLDTARVFEGVRGFEVGVADLEGLG